MLAVVRSVDRALAGFAEQRAGASAGAPLGRPARVRVHGEPFVSQVLRGRYRDIEITASNVTVGAIAGTTLHARLRGVRLPLRDLLGRRVRELPVERVTGSVVLPYAELARISRVPGLRLQHQNGRLVAGAALPLPGLAQLAQVSGEAVATISEGGGIWLRVRNVGVSGLTVPGIVLNQILPALAFPVPLPPLPYGLRINALTPVEDGLQVFGAADHVVFGRPDG